ncbi:MAG TPA: extracellular solute-binding protein [Casimicrobiaceae bacterium]|jgi:iron(III) transport system substrate-binding protein
MPPNDARAQPVQGLRGRGGGCYTAHVAMILRMPFRAVIAVALVLGFVGAACAQAPTGIALATYEGADRAEKLVEGARKEGDVLVYTSAPSDDFKALTEAFEKKYGVKVKFWRSSADKVAQRGISEGRAKRFEADVFETDSGALDALMRENLLTPVRSPMQDELRPDVRFGHQSWFGSRLNVFALAYNTKALKKTDLPHSYEALLEPKWKGKLGVEAEDSDWFSALCQQLGEQKTTRLFREIVARNGVSVRRGHADLASLVASGDIPLALTAYDAKIERMKAKGAPIDWFVIPPAIARMSGVGVAARAPHPHAALLWLDFELSEEGQRVLLEHDFVPTNRRIETKLDKFPLRYIDSNAIIDDGAKWDKLYAEIFGHGKDEEKRRR